MIFSTTALLGASLLSGLVSAAPTVSYTAGFNMGANRADGACKSVEDWKVDFQRIKSWGAQNSGYPKAKFNSVKIFSTSDCWALDNAVNAALQVGGIKIWAGLWTVPDDKFENDKKALEKQLNDRGGQAHEWLAGINVGSEALYRNETQPWKLASQIYDVRGMVHEAFKQSWVPVGCADTWTSWVNGSNYDVIKASDVILINGFPYWQDAHVDNGLAKFQEAITNTRNAVGWDKPFLVGETGWPTGGENRGPAEASLGALQSYWKQTMCWLQKQDFGYYWFSGIDEPQRTSDVERNFGVAYPDGTPKVEMDLSKIC